jgi:hypothetical protein
MIHLRQKSIQGIASQPVFQLLASGILLLLAMAQATSIAQSAKPAPQTKQTSDNVKQEEIKEMPEKPCVFVDVGFAFAGTPLEQAKCLLRPVARYGKLGEPLKKLPEPLEELVGKSIAFDKETLRSFLQQQKIKEEDLGGSLDDTLSRANDNNPGAPVAQYFVIHDVSTPNYPDESFPVNINEKTWEWNDLQSKWLNNKVAHIFINRLGESVTAIDFNTAWRATKLEVKVLKEKSKGLFLHTELVQPRRRDPNGSPKNDAIAPFPGFTDAQLERLALVYIAASVRGGMWMIPAYHAGVDAGIPDAHDDPQNFDLQRWANALGRLLKQINSQPKLDAK